MWMDANSGTATPICRIFSYSKKCIKKSKRKRTKCGDGSFFSILLAQHPWQQWSSVEVQKSKISFLLFRWLPWWMASHLPIPKLHGSVSRQLDQTDGWTDRQAYYRPCKETQEVRFHTPVKIWNLPDCLSIWSDLSVCLPVRPSVHVTPRSTWCLKQKTM